MKTKLNFLATGIFLAGLGTGLSQSTVQFTTNIYDVGEADGSVTLTVQRTNDTSSAVSVDFATADGTATNGLHYAATNGTLVFGPGETNKNLVVPILNEGFVEGTRTFRVTLSNPTNAVLGTRTNATVRRADNDVGLQTQFATCYTREGEAFESSAWCGAMTATSR